MEIKAEISNKNGTVDKMLYTDSDSFDTIQKDDVKQVYAVCFLGDQMLIVFNGKQQRWGLVGGKPEPGESFEDCLRREVKEESNMKVLSFKPLGMQRVSIQGKGDIYQLRYACTIEMLGPFIEDPADESITKILLINPTDYKTYFDWGEIGARIVSRALEIKPLL